MSLAIKELTHLKNFTHKNYNKRGKVEAFCVEFPRERKELFFLRFFHNFLSFLFP